MRYKDFIFQSAQTAITGKEGGLEPLVAFAKHVIEKASPFNDPHRVHDPDKEIIPFMEKLEKAGDDAAKEALCGALAKLLDESAARNRFWYVIPYDKFYISMAGDNQIFFNWLEQEYFCAPDTKIIPKEIKIKYQEYLIRRLNSGIIKQELLNHSLSIEAFLHFLLKAFYPQMPPNSRLSHLDFLKIGLTRLNMHPEEKYFIIDSIQNPNHLHSCYEIVEKFFNARKDSIFKTGEAEDMVWEFGFHSVHGRNKKSTQNEDSYAVIGTENGESLFLMVADGVSTAQLGSGKIISNKILEICEDSFQNLKDYMDTSASLPTDDWLHQCKKQLVDILTKLNEYCVEELNRKLSSQSFNKPFSEQQYMSSTVIVGFVNKNRCIFAYVGDSDIFHIRGGDIMRLNEEHNNRVERIADYVQKSQTQPFQPMPEDSHLTRVIPKADYLEKEKKYIPDDIEEDISFVAFRPRENDVIIISTDGLIDSIGGTRNDIENEKAVLEAYCHAMTAPATARELARRIACKADEKSGIDDITLIV